MSIQSHRTVRELGGKSPFLAHVAQAVFKRCVRSTLISLAGVSSIATFSAAHASECDLDYISPSVGITAEGPIGARRGDDGEAVMIETGTMGSEGTIRLSRSVDGLPANCDAADRPKAFVSRGFDLTLRSPLGDGGERRDVASLDGLAGGVSAEFGRFWSYTSGYPEREPTKEEVEAAIAEAHRRCKLRAETRPSLQCDEPSLSGENDDVEGYIDDYYPEFYTSRLQTFPTTTLFRISGKVGFDEFSYLDPTTLESEKDQNFEYQIGVNIDRILLRRRLAFSASAMFESAFEEQDEEVLCLPLETPDAAPQCVGGRGGAPEREERFIVGGEIRHISGLRFFDRNVGVAASVQHRFDDNVTGIEVPIFLIPNTDKGLTFGVNTGYRDDTDDVSVGLFVGGSFGLFPQQRLNES